MADSEHNVRINISGSTSSAVSAFNTVKTALLGIRRAANQVMSALGVFGMAMNGVQALISAFNWLKEKITETSREIARMRFEYEMNAAAAATDRLVKSHERLAALMKDELDTLSKQRAIESIAQKGKDDYEAGRREAERARQIYEAKTPDEEQALRDRFAAEDEQRAREANEENRKRQIRSLDDEESVYTSKAEALRRNNAGIDEQIAAERFNLVRANGNEDYTKQINERLAALKKRKEANEAEIAQFEKEAAFRRDQIAALENIKDYNGTTAGEWQRKTEAKKRAEKQAEEEAKAKEEAERKARDEAERETERQTREKVRADSERLNDLTQFTSRVDSADQVSQNRLTAMGLGSGVKATGGVASDVKRLVDLLKQEIQATKENKPSDTVAAATFGE